VNPPDRLRDDVVQYQTIVIHGGEA
jgi:hypothetical protein